MTVAIGARNVRGTLHGPTKATLPSGQVQKTYAPLAANPVEYAEVRPLRGTELIRAQQKFGETPAGLRFRYRTDLTAEGRFETDQGVTWEFTSIPMDPDGKRRRIEVMAVARV